MQPCVGRYCPEITGESEKHPKERIGIYHEKIALVHGREISRHVRERIDVLN